MRPIWLFYRLGKPENSNHTAGSIRLYPHAWLRVKLKNESGLAGFGSSQLIDGYPSRVYQSKGDSLSITILVKGNTDFRLIFSLIKEGVNTTRDISTLFKNYRCV